jgi:accessory gene regulator protein AgrB
MSAQLSVIGILFIVATVLSFISFLVSPFVARRKGYAPYFWLFACGPIGLAVIACLPSTKTAATPEEMEQMESRANTTGAILSGLTLLIVIGLIIPAVIVGGTSSAPNLNSSGP